MTNENRMAEALFEPLEARRLLSAVLSSEGVLALTGTDQADTMSVRAGEVAGQVLVFGVPGVDDGTMFEGVTSLRMRLLGGNDNGSIIGTPLDTLGNPLGVTMFGSRGDDTLIGGSGPDTLKGGGGGDVLFGGAGVDLLQGNSGNDVIFGGDGNDRLVGGSGDDELHGEDGNDRILGNTNSDELFGEGGDDILLGGNGPDMLDGGIGNDVLEGKGGADTLFGGPGDDSLKGLNGHDRLFGGDGNDFLKGNRGNDLLEGGRGNDDLFGSVGRDTLYGGSGTDRLFGEGGRDVFRGPFFERRDFSSDDAFHSPGAAAGDAFSVIPVHIWDAIDVVADGPGLNDLLWGAVDGSQQLLAVAGLHNKAVQAVLEQFTDQEIDEVVGPTIDRFLSDIGHNLDGLTTARVFTFLEDIEDLAPDDVRAPVTRFIQAWRDNRSAVDAVVAGTREAVRLGLLDDTFREALSIMLLDILDLV